MIKTLWLCALVLLLPAGPALAQLYFRNNTKETVTVAYAMKKDPAATSTWFSQGWFRVKPKEKVLLNQTMSPFQILYYYVVSADGKHKYEGTMPPFVDLSTTTFLIKEPEMMQTWKGHPTYSQIPFRLIRLKQGAVPKLYTIEFKG